MRTYLKTALIAFTSILFLVMLLGTVSTVRATYLIWQGEVSSSGDPVLSPILEDGKEYYIVVSEMFWYDYPSWLGADAQYYTTDSSDAWNWGNHFPAPGGHSFLQINGEDVDWGPFSNGDTGHTYSIFYNGTGAAITFKIVDWIDGNYNNNECHLSIKIYERVTVGGQIYESVVKTLMQLSTILVISFTLTILAVSLYRLNKCHQSSHTLRF
ncbi:MAG: hypothetical protein ACTSV7_07715 [Candidatus Baldrarchaeia archaeon]